MVRSSDVFGIPRDMPGGDPPDSSTPPFEVNGIDEDRWTPLLESVHTFHDPVHRDIEATALELAVIDTPTFQAFREIKQLGTAYVRFHGATHTRFEHMIGTLGVVEEMIQNANQNVHRHVDFGAVPVLSRDHVMARLAALLHDVAHIAYGHQLEEEGVLFGGGTPGGSQWGAAPEHTPFHRQREHPAAVLRKVVIEHLVGRGFDKGEAEQFYEDVMHAVGSRTKQGQAPAYVKDLVAGAFDADRLDYIARDTHYTGHDAPSNHRVIRNLAILPLVKEGDELHLQSAYSGNQINGDDEDPGSVRRRKLTPPPAVNRVVLITTDAQDAAVSWVHHVNRESEVIGAVMDLLRSRQRLSVEVYHERTKARASALLIGAANRVMRGAPWSVKEPGASLERKHFQGKGDHEVIAMLRVEAERISKLPLLRNFVPHVGADALALLDDLKARRLPQIVAEYTREEAIDVLATTMDRDKAEAYLDDQVKKLRKPEHRIRTELEVACTFALDGPLLVHVPAQKVINPLKGEVLVTTPDACRAVHLSEHNEGTSQDMEALRHRHTDAWTIRVLVRQGEFGRPLTQVLRRQIFLAVMNREDAKLRNWGYLHTIEEYLNGHQKELDADLREKLEKRHAELHAEIPISGNPHGGPGYVRLLNPRRALNEIIEGHFP